jgi:SnoaL-like domain
MMLSNERLADLEQIRDLAMRFSQGLDREDADLLRSVFWPDATDDHGWLFQGSAWEFVDMILPRRERVRPTLHVVSNHRITFVGDDLATGEVYGTGFQFRHAIEDPSVRMVLGRYLDRYERRDEEWRIAHRAYVLEGTFAEATRSAEHGR